VLRLAISLCLQRYDAPKLHENGVLAESMLHGQGFSLSVIHPPKWWCSLDFEARCDTAHSLSALMRPQPSANQAPGYPFLLCLLWRMFGRTPATHLALSVMQAILMAAMVFPVYSLAFRWFGSKPGAAWAAWIVAFLPPYLWTSSTLHHTALATAVYPWLLLGWLRVRNEKCWWLVLLLGAGTGVAAHFQPMLLAVFGLFCLWLLISSLLSSDRSAALRLVVAGVLTVMVLVPWTVRNYRVHSRIILLKNCFAKELWIGNNRHATGTAVLPGGEKRVFGLLPQYVSINENMTEMELMDRMGSLAWDNIRAHPMNFVVRTMKKVAWFWTWVPGRYLGALDTRSTFRSVMIAYWLGLLAAFFYSLRFVRRIPREYGVWLICIVGVYSAVYGLTFVGHARFRAEVEFAFIPLASCGVAHVWGMLIAVFKGRR